MPTPRKRKKTAGKVHELKELEVREVSLVDHPANGRRFSMVKSEDGEGMADDKHTEITLDADGKFTTPEPAPGNVAVTIAPVFKAVASISKIFESEDIAKRLSVPEEIKTEAFKRIRESMRRLDTAMSTVGMSQTADGETAFSKLVGDELLEVAAVIAGIGKRFGGSKRSSAKKSDPSESDFAEVLLTVQTALTDAMSDIEKRGAKMAAPRLKNFELALEQLTKILIDLRGTSFPGKSETKKALEYQGRIDELVKENDDSKSTIRKQAIELKKLRAARVLSATIPVEKTQASSVAGSDTSWPLDLNNDPATAKIDKSVDFRD